jgi:monoamine oxidase
MLLEDRAAGVRRMYGRVLDTSSRRFCSGAQSLAGGLAARLPPRALSLSDPVWAVEATEEGVLVSAQSGQARARAAVIALPPALAVQDIAFTPPLSPETARIAQETAVWMGGVVKAVAVFDEPFWTRQGLSGSAISNIGPFREFHDMSGPDGSPAALLGFASSSAFEASHPGAAEAAFRDQLARLLGPDAGRPLEVLVTDWSREEFTSPATPSARASTGTYGHRIFQDGASGGRIQWCSTETSPDFPGHIEGAIQSGIRAAGKLIGLPVPST